MIWALKNLEKLDDSAVTMEERQAASKQNFALELGAPEEYQQHHIAEHKVAYPAQQQQQQQVVQHQQAPVAKPRNSKLARTPPKQVAVAINNNKYVEEVKPVAKPDMAKPYKSNNKATILQATLMLIRELDQDQLLTLQQQIDSLL